MTAIKSCLVKRSVLCQTSPLVEAINTSPVFNTCTSNEVGEFWRSLISIVNLVPITFMIHHHIRDVKINRRTRSRMTRKESICSDITYVVNNARFG